MSVNKKKKNNCSKDSKELFEQKKYKSQDFLGSRLFHNVGDICNRGVLISPEEKAVSAYLLFEKDPELTSICIVDEKNHFKGLLTKTEIMTIFGGRYGYSLNQKKKAGDVANKNTLIVSKNLSIENVSRLAMERCTSELYVPIVVLEQKKYCGIVTVKDLLTATVSIEVEKANELNPLTELPGNKLIDKEIHQLIGQKEFFAIMYLDLDNFKAYNDAYGFPNGDKMIGIVASAMKKIASEKDFLGHVGGDDFVIITNSSDVHKKADDIIHEFKDKIRGLYNKEDLKRGYIISQNRKGYMEQFPIATISIAIISNHAKSFNTLSELTEQIVILKKKAKQIDGNSIVVL